MKNTDWKSPTKYIVGVGVTLLGIYILYLSRPVLPLLVVAALLAVLIRPLVSWLQQRAHLPRGLAVGMVYLVLAVIGPLFILLILPPIIDALVYVGSLDYQSLLQSGVEWLRSTLIAIKAVQLPLSGLDVYVDGVIDAVLAELATFSPVTAVPQSFADIIQPLSSALMSVIHTSANLVGVIISRAAMIGFAYLASIWMSLDAHTYRSAFLQALPAAYRPEIENLLDRISRVWNAFFHGELILMLVIGVMTTLGLTAIGMPGALYLGIIAGLLEIIPNLGPIIATVPAVIVALLYGSTYLPVSNLAFAGIVILLYIVVQQLENNLIVPRVLGDALNLPPVVVMTGVFVGASAGGILGALIATPVIATGREVLGYIYRKMLNLETIVTEELPVETNVRPSSNWQAALSAAIQKMIHMRPSKSHHDSGKD